jgi:hypothetical protein
MLRAVSTASLDELLAQDSGSIPDLVHRHAIERPGHTALIAGDDRLDFAGLDALVNRVAAALQRDGVGPGGAVAIAAAASIPYVATYLGTVRAGAKIAPLQPSVTPDSLAAMIGDAGASHVFLDAAVGRTLATASRPVTAARVALERSETGGGDPDGFAGGAGGRAPRGIDELSRQVASLADLHGALEALVHEHDQWQEIDNNLRLLVGSGAGAADELAVSWPLLRGSIAEVVQAGGAAGWTRVVDAAAQALDGELARGAEAGKCLASLRSLWRRCNQRFVDVDKQLLRTCEELRQVGDTLDSVLTVIDDG